MVSEDMKISWYSSLRSSFLGLYMCVDVYNLLKTSLKEKQPLSSSSFSMEAENSRAKREFSDWFSVK